MLKKIQNKSITFDLSVIENKLLYTWNASS